MTILAVLLELYWDGEEWITSLNSVWSSYSFVLSFLVVFRNNQAYSRFWEGATLMNEMRGEWLNVCTRFDRILLTRGRESRGSRHFPGAFSED